LIGSSNEMKTCSVFPWNVDVLIFITELLFVLLIILGIATECNTGIITSGFYVQTDIHILFVRYSRLYNHADPPKQTPCPQHLI